MVGPGEVDEELEPEVKEECETKYGDIIRVTSATWPGSTCASWHSGTFQVKIVERVGVAPEETVRIFLEFKRVESAIKGEFSPLN